MPPEARLEQLASVEQQLKAQQQRHQPQEGGSGKSETAATGATGQDQGQGKEAQGKEGSGQGKEGSGSGQRRATGQGQGKGDRQRNWRCRQRHRQRRGEADWPSPQGYRQGPGPTGSAGREANSLKAIGLRCGQKATVATTRRATGHGELESTNNGNLEQLKSPGQIRPVAITTRNRTRGRPRHRASRSARISARRKAIRIWGNFLKRENLKGFTRPASTARRWTSRTRAMSCFASRPQRQSGGGGKTVTDNERRSATVPYENLPLNAERIAAEPGRTPTRSSPLP